MSGCEENTPTFFCFGSKINVGVWEKHSDIFLFYGIKKLSIFEISDIIFRYNIFYDENTKEIINMFYTDIPFETLPAFSIQKKSYKFPLS